jgi:hypothetical protein
MNKDFAPYQPSFDMKGLGFNEPCFGHFLKKKFYLKYFDRQGVEITLAPLYQQAFRWFRKKHNLVFNFINYNIVKPGEYHWSITWNDEAKASGIVKTYEQAELACLIKLIEIVKEK